MHIRPERQEEQVEIYFKALNLVGQNNNIQPDSFLIVFLRQNNAKRQVLKTSVSHKNSSPAFVETLKMIFQFEKNQQIEVQVHQRANPKIVIGRVQMSIGDIIGSRSKGFCQQILDIEGNTRGNLISNYEYIGENNNNQFIEFNVTADDLQGYFCPFLQRSYFFSMYKVTANGEFLIYQSQSKAGTQLEFGRVNLCQQKLLNNSKQLKIVFYKCDSICRPQIYAIAVFKDYQFQSYTKKILRNGKNQKKGIITLHSFERYTKHRFLQYITAGMQIALVTCIDFTSSNGDYYQPDSLHYSTPNKKSQYEEALEPVSKILIDLDKDKLVPMYGFGAKVWMNNLHTGNKVCHYFPLNGNYEDPNFFQLEGVMQGYRNSMKYLSFSGPTQFAPLLSQAMKECQRMKAQRRQYMVLLILTDGQICDEENVKQLLVDCGRLPLSIIIVGIGDKSNWKIMHRLDDDQMQMTNSKGKKTERDLVQFVQFKKYQNDGTELARQVLFQLPRQVQQYNRLVKLSPNDYRNG